MCEVFSTQMKFTNKHSIKNKTIPHKHQTPLLGGAGCCENANPI